jgi:hypothetical protein
VRLFVGPRFSQLLRNPESIGVSRHIEVQDLSPVMTDDEEAIPHDGSRSDQDERLRPSGPKRFQRDPEQLVQGSQSTARSFGVQGQQLLTESQVFEDEILPGTESADHPAEDMPDRHEHGKNLIGTVRSELFAKSFILWVCDVLARDSEYESDAQA